MACFLMHQEDVQLCIPSFETTDSVTYYVIEIKIGSVKWTVKHRYVSEQGLVYSEIAFFDNKLLVDIDSYKSPSILHELLDLFTFSC